MTDRQRRAGLAVAVITSVWLSACTAAPGASPTGAPPAEPSAVATAAPTAAATSVSTDRPVPSSTAAPSASWARVNVTGPAAREDHTLTHDPAGRAAWLFGGRDGGTTFDDLWRFDLDTNEWQRVSVEGRGPAARFGHTGTWVEGLGLVVWSGQRGATFFDDLWAFSPQTGRWEELPAAELRPPARYGSCAALGPDERLWVTHGFTADEGRFADTWAYDFRERRWIESTPDGDLPVVRCLHDCLWTPDGRLVLYAGQTTGVPAIGDLWTRAVDTGWTEGPAPAPPPRQLYAVAAIESSAWIFGGGGEDRSRLADLWRLDLASLAWTQASPTGDGPSGRSGAALAAAPDQGRLILFGGLADDGASDETWELVLGG